MRMTTTLLDTILPDYDVREQHQIWIPSSPSKAEATWRALSPQQIRLLYPLFRVRTLPAWIMGRPSPLPEADEPFLDQMLDHGFVTLAHEPEREIVVGAVNRFWDPIEIDRDLYRDRGRFTAFDEPRYNKAATNFRFTPKYDGTLVTTETRVRSTDGPARRRFYTYWTLIRPGSALIRRSWLWALRREASRQVEHYELASGD